MRNLVTTVCLYSTVHSFKLLSNKKIQCISYHYSLRLCLLRILFLSSTSTMIKNYPRITTATTDN